MSDLELRSATRTDPDSFKSRYNEYRVSGIFRWMVGDTITVNEVVTPWARDSWVAKIIEIKSGNAFYVEPLDRSKVTFGLDIFRDKDGPFYITTSDIEGSLPAMPD